jgi:hypothetical protein
MDARLPAPLSLVLKLPGEAVVAALTGWLDD